MAKKINPGKSIIIGIILLLVMIPLDIAYFMVSGYYFIPLIAVKLGLMIYGAKLVSKNNFIGMALFVYAILSFFNTFIVTGHVEKYYKLQSDKISKGLPTVKCVEMEGAAVAQVCFEYNKPFSIIRTISDNANNNAHVDFPKFANEIASKYALGILKNYLSLQ